MTPLTASFDRIRCRLSEKDGRTDILLSVRRGADVVGGGAQRLLHVGNEIRRHTVGDTQGDYGLVCNAGLIQGALQPGDACLRVVDVDRPVGP